MNGNRSSDIEISRKDGFIKSDVSYDDDGFFSDVPSSGSLSKSRIALNKYLKKNLLYEDVDQKDDSAYFSKEGSPNESVSKSDTESVKSNESYRTKRPLSHDASITEFMKSYESDRHQLSKGNRPKSHDPKSDANNVNNYGSEHVQYANITECAIKSKLDYKIYPKESWPDKYRRNSDFVSLKSSEVNKTKRSMSQGEEYLKSYALNKNYEFKPNKFVTSIDFIKTAANKTKQSFLESNNMYLGLPSQAITITNHIKPESQQKTEPQYENVSVSTAYANCIEPEQQQITEVKYENITNVNNQSYQKDRRESDDCFYIKAGKSYASGNNRLSKENNNFNLDKEDNAFDESPETKDNATIIRIGTYSESDQKNELSLIKKSHIYDDSSSECIDSNYCLTPPRYTPQEATITITKIVMAYDPDHKGLIKDNKQLLNVPNSEPEKLNSNQPDTKLPFPVPLPRSSSLRRDYKPYVQKSILSNDNESYDLNTTIGMQNPRNAETLNTKEFILQESPAVAGIVSSYGKKYESDVADHVEQTDDYKSMQLLENLKLANHYDPRQDAKYSTEPRQALKNSTVSASLINLSKQNNPYDVSQNTVPLREKSARLEEHRHTLHDFTGWVNRTTKYPDVYAPMPYKSPRRYVESDVNIHYRCPVRHDPLPLVPEKELARQQAEHMKRLYREQKRNKYLQELQDMQSRRHQDNFLPKEKSILPLNRYDEADRVVARALYAFNGQTARELSFRKGDLIHVRRQIDANWYEGELHGRHGLFPYNYVEILKGDVAQSPRKPSVVEGRARAKFDFTAQTNLELPLKKGELVTLTRRIDHNWWEGRRESRTGIFPDSYITVLQEPSQSKPEPEQVQNQLKPVASPAAHGLMNGSAKRSMGAHSYTPTHNNPALCNAPQPTQPLQGYTAKPAQASLTPSERGYGPPTTPGVDLNNSEPLYVDTNAEAVPYRAMYKYRPQNPDELELCEGDTVYVLEQCDDGWYVGSSQRTGRFGTFPGNYVERI